VVVDDSVVIRRLVSSILNDDPEIEVVGTAANGRIALAKINQFQPDLITLDLEMTEMDGLATLSALKQRYPRLPVIIFSTLTELGARATINALSNGASDYVTKPSSSLNVAESSERVRAQLIPKIKSLIDRARLRPHLVDSRGERLAARSTNAHQAGDTGRHGGAKPARQHNVRIGVVAIGVSTGGPAALGELLPRLPAAFPVPVIIVQHMPPMFTRLLAERLDAASILDVREAEQPCPLVAGQAWVAPGGRHLIVARSGAKMWTALDDGPPENSCRPSVDVLFRSVAEHYGAGVLGVVLTGMGLDGLRGARAICEGGGRVITQDEGSSVVWGMPGAVAGAGLSDRIVPLVDMADEIISRVTNSQRHRQIV